jgi:apolipoprotein N-acyltransferase
VIALADSKRRAALSLYALSTLLSFPHEIPGIGSIDLGLVAAWWAPAALVVGIEGVSVRRAAVLAFCASLLGHALIFHWFFVVTVLYGGMPIWLGVLSPLLPALYVSAFSALFAIGWSSSRRRGRASILLGAALWVTLDWARAHFMGGFPWATLGYALHLDVPLLGITRVTGVYGLSFLVAALGLALGLAHLHRDRRAIRAVAFTALGIVCAHALSIGLRSGSPEQSERVRIAAVQGNIDQGEKWDEARRIRILETYLRLSEAAVARGAEWVVWPETAVPGFIELDPVLADRLALFARQHEVPLFVGGMGAAPDASGRRIGAFFDSAFVFDRDGEIVDRYDKAHLVPFGEYVPLRGLFGRFFEALATGLSSTDVTPGDRPRVLLPLDLGAGGAPLRVAVPICYELLFPHVMRKFGADGAGVMLAITNDAWYGRTGAPHQFLAMTAMRAAENGRWMVRAANTGVSAIIDDEGRVRERSSLFEEEIVVADVPVSRSPSPTFYARFGDVFAWICALAVVGQIGWGLFRDRRGRSAYGAEDVKGGGR